MKKDKYTLDLRKEEEIKNRNKIKRMLTIAIITLTVYFVILLLAINYLEEGTLFGVIICVSTIILVGVAFYIFKLEISAGYYECKKCHHRYVPESYFKALITPHINLTRYMKCPKCHKWSWSKKVYTKD